MRTTFFLLALAACSVSGGSTPAPTQDGGGVLPCRITSVGLFKNGLALVRREVALPGDGSWEVSGLPEAVHGTLWIESDADLVARVTRRSVEVPLGAMTHDLQRDLAGRTVRLRLLDEGSKPIAGRVLQLENEQEWSRSYEQPLYRHWAVWPSPASATVQPTSRFLVLESEGRTLYVDTGRIVSLEVDQDNLEVKRRRPVLVLEVSGQRGPATASISYLTKGVAWAPSYRVDLSHPRKLSIQQKAVLRNELEDFEDAEVQLISGFPSVEFSHVLSPLSPATSWAGFFQQLNQQVGRGSGNQVVTQQAVLYNAAPPQGSPQDSGVIPAGEGVDLHYQPIGRRSMAAGDSLMLSVARSTAAYERVVEWLVPDTRDENGHLIEEYRRQQDPEQYEDSAWDAVRFANPFDFPMTTAPATVVEGERFGGQQLSRWVNPGERTTLRITKALSIRTTSTELEQEGERDIVNVGGRRFRKPLVTGELRVANHRAEPITLVVRRRFSGDLIAADGSPEKVLREEGVTSVNPRRELTWTLELGPGEERTLEYRYSLLVSH